MSKPIVFISYAHEDRDWMERIRVQLGAIEQLGEIRIWDDQRIKAGSEWYPEILASLNKAAVSICLISAPYLASDFINREEIPALNERRKTEGMLLIPVLITPCAWKLVPWLKALQIMPGEGKALSQLTEAEQDSAMALMVEDVHDKINDPAFELAKPKSIWAPPERVDIERLPRTGSELFGRTRELQLLDEAWDSDSFNVISFVAWGGVGKSTLVNKWLSYMEREDYRGACAVYGWSFYSQGTNERVTSADQFINAALAWFGDPAMAQSQASPWDKGNRLAQLVRAKKTLLLLDGLEPLQSGLAIERGQVKDPALAVVIKELAQDNPGLCVITTRLAVPELGRFPDRVQSIDLDQISPEAGASLLRLRGVRGSDSDLQNVTRAFGCHALAVHLLAEFLHQIPGHAVTEARRIPDLPDISEDEGKHPRRIMEALVAQYGPGPELELLQILGLFDRPAAQALVDAVIRPNNQAPIPGLTDHLCALDQGAWLRLLQKLRSVGLLAPESRHAPEQIDCHPLVREHFGEKLKSTHPEAWRTGHQRLYQQLCETTKEGDQPTLEDLQPLYQAVSRGCQAGLQQEVCEKVYWERIKRRDENYSSRKLGAFGSDLGAVTCFFETPWSSLSPALTEVWKAWLLSEAAFRLRALGRLTEALEPMRAGLEMCINQENWKQVAIHASNLSELELTLGLLKPTVLSGVEVAGAVGHAELSVTYADRSGDGFRKIVSRCAVGDALHQAGRRTQAQACFREAEEMRAQRQPEYPMLYSLEGFRYCDLLLTEAECAAGRKDEGASCSSDSDRDEVLEACRAVEQRAAKMFEWRVPDDPLLDVALDHLTLGRAALYEAILERSALHKPKSEIEQAVDGLRRAGTTHHLPRALLTRAWCSFAEATEHRLNGREQEAAECLIRAQRDLDEAWEIAERGSMKLHMADIHLHRARLFGGKDEVGRLKDERGYPWESPFADLDAAAKLIEETRYHRRDEELADLREAAKGWFHE